MGMQGQGGGFMGGMASGINQQQQQRLMQMLMGNLETANQNQPRPMTPGGPMQGPMPPMGGVPLWNKMMSMGRGMF